MRLHRVMEDPLVETIITLLTPFAGFIPAEAVHASGVLAVVTMGLYVSRHSHAIFSPATRLHAVGAWDVTVFILNGLVFTLLGLQLPATMEAIRSYGESPGQLLLWAAGLCVVLVVVRMVWVFPAAYLPRVMFRSIRRREKRPPWQSVFMVAYIGMRGATSLAAALALPLTTDAGDPFPQRGLILFLTFAAILFTLVGQSLTLPTVVRWIGVHEDPGEDPCEEWDARLRGARAALARIGELETTATGVQRRTLERLRNQYEERVQRLAGADADEAAGRCATEAEVEVSVYRGVIEAERAAVVSLRDAAQIGDEVRRRIEYDLDLECARLTSIETGGA
jgi:CPA1 family monovalent cation:H+ antiporter